MKMFNFNSPQEKLEAQLFRREVDLSKVVAGSFVRNSVLSGMSYGGNMLVPAFLKTRDAIHPLAGTQSIDGEMQSCYGGLLDSADTDATKAAIRCVVQPWNTATVWAPGGQGLNSWLAAKLPEATLIEKYIIASTSSTCPLSWVLQASNDGESWTDIDTVSNTEMWSLNTREEKTFEIPAETRGTYLWYRLKVTATNATTMSISTFRLLRPASVCAKGQLLLDASAGDPLIMSFMDGFAADGVTPVDHIETLSSTFAFDLETMNSNIPAVTTEGWAHCDIVASKYTGGGYGISLEACNTSNALFNNAGMKNNHYGGFKVTYVNGEEAPANAHKKFCQYDTNSLVVSQDLLFTRQDGRPFYVEKIYNNRSMYGFYILELDGSYSEKMSPDNKDVSIKRQIKGIRRARSGPSADYYVYIYSCGSPFKYRFSGGKLYQQERNISDDWTPVQKIKLGSCDIMDGEIVNLSLRTAPSLVWQTDGNNLSTLG